MMKTYTLQGKNEGIYKSKQICNLNFHTNTTFTYMQQGLCNSNEEAKLYCHVRVHPVPSCEIVVL